MINTESLKIGFGIGFVIGLVIGLSFASSDRRAAEVITEYKAGKLVCVDVGPELVCRGSK